MEGYVCVCNHGLSLYGGGGGVEDQCIHTSSVSFTRDMVSWLVLVWGGDKKGTYIGMGPTFFLLSSYLGIYPHPPLPSAGFPRHKEKRVRDSRGVEAGGHKKVSSIWADQYVYSVLRTMQESKALTTPQRYSTKLSVFGPAWSLSFLAILVRDKQMLQHNGGFFNRCITKRCFHNWTKSVIY